MDALQESRTKPAVHLDAQPKIRFVRLSRCPVYCLSPIFVPSLPSVPNRTRPTLQLAANTTEEDCRILGRRGTRYFASTSGLTTRTGLPSRKASAFSTICG